MRKRWAWLAGCSALALGGVVAVPVVSQGSTAASVRLSAGSLAFNVSTATLIFSATPSSNDQTTTSTLPFDIGDATGSGAGWNVTATSTMFTSTTHTLAAAAATITSEPTAACDSREAACTTATTIVSYPYTLPAAPSAPTATTLFNAAPNTGLGNQNFTPTWTLAIPANAPPIATAYTSTWTLSLVSAP